MLDMLADISKEKAVSLPNAKYVLFLIDRMDSPAFCNALGRFTEPGLKNTSIFNQILDTSIFNQLLFCLLQIF